MSKIVATFGLVVFKPRFWLDRGGWQVKCFAALFLININIVSYKVSSLLPLAKYVWLVEPKAKASALN